MIVDRLQFTITSQNLIRSNKIHRELVLFYEIPIEKYKSGLFSNEFGFKF